MSTIKIFKDSSGLLSFNGVLMPANLIAIQNIDSTHIHIHPLDNSILNFWYEPTGKTYNITEILNAVDVSYTTIAEFLDVVSASQSDGTHLKAFHNNVVRPANTTVYTAGDVVGSILTIADVAKIIGSGVKVHRIRIQTNDTGVAGKKFNVHIYNDLPANVPADNAAFTIDWADAQKRIGAIPVVMGVGNLATVGMNDYNEYTLNPVARAVYVVLETVDGFTPSNNSTEFQITIDTELSNN